MLYIKDDMRILSHILRKVYDEQVLAGGGPYLKCHHQGGKQRLDIFRVFLAITRHTLQSIAQLKSPETIPIYLQKQCTHPTAIHTIVTRICCRYPTGGGSTSQSSRDRSKMLQKRSACFDTNEYRVVIFGDACVGKTSLLQRFLKNSFREHYSPTIEDTYSQVSSYL